MKKAIPFFLMLVLLLQLLPVQAAVQYFFVDNLIIEEIQPTKNPVKNCKLTADDHNLPGIVTFSLVLQPLTSAKCWCAVVHLPSTRAQDIHTPPPNL